MHRVVANHSLITVEVLFRAKLKMPTPKENITAKKVESMIRVRSIWSLKALQPWYLPSCAVPHGEHLAVAPRCGAQADKLNYPLNYTTKKPTIKKPPIRAQAQHSAKSSRPWWEVTNCCLSDK